MDFFFTTITWIGSLYLLVPFTVALCALLLWFGKYGYAFLISSSVACTSIAVHVTKLMFRRPRPSATELLVTMPSDWSFPSAHTAQVAAFFLSVTVLAFQALPPLWANVVAISAGLLVGVVGYSRVYLQVHYVSDVLAGGVVAIIVVSVMHFVLPFLPWINNK